MASSKIALRDWAWDDENGVIVVSFTLDGRLHAMRLQPCGDPEPVVPPLTPDGAVAEAAKKPPRVRRLPGEPEPTPADLSEYDLSSGER